MRASFLGIAAIALLCTAASAAGAQSPAAAVAEPPKLRLPAGARPVHDALTLTVVPGEAKGQGEIAIDVELERPHAVLWLNADSLNVTRASVESAEARVSLLSGHEQFVGLAFDPELPTGRDRVRLWFEADQSRNTTRGIFALEDGGAWYTMTHFEPISARRAFPCFDEPGFKTPWQLTLQVPRGLTALANTRVESESSDSDDFTTVRFAETRPLPSYLVAFSVGPWEFVDVGKVGANPTRRATNDYIVANFDSLAKTVGTEEPGRWPVFASGLCTERDRVDLEAFRKERVPRYAAASRELSGAVEAIDLCPRVRAANKRNGFGSRR